MRTAKQIIENIEDRMVYIDQEIKQDDNNEIYYSQLQAISAELDDLLS